MSTTQRSARFTTESLLIVLRDRAEGEVIAIDGHCVRRSLDKASNKAAIHRQSVLGHGRMA